MKIQILGSGCAKCNLLETNTKAAIAELGLTVPVDKITDFGRIGDMGVMVTPALAIDYVVKSSGKVLTKDQIIQIIKEAT